MASLRVQFMGFRLPAVGTGRPSLSREGFRQADPAGHGRLRARPALVLKAWSCMEPLVAVTTTMVPEGGGSKRPAIALYAIYLAVLERLGLTSVLITPAHSPRSVQLLLQRCSGLVLSGGEDVDPSRYGEEAIAELGMVNPARDAMEISVLGLALERELPILGICRGCQLMNVFFGGTLYQDVDTQHPGEVYHRQREPWGRRTHDVTIEPSSALVEIIGSERLLINSFHHQAIREVAPALEVVARAEDGLIEAVEARDYEWVIGVQWHPERHEAKASATDPDRRILAAFRHAAVERALRE
jgi:putative glutamine amidotransferase